MKHLNFCRQAQNQIATQLKNNVFDKKEKSKLEFFWHLLNKSVKFLLQEGGRFLADTELKALDVAQKLSLPFETIALEYLNVNQDVPLLPGETRIPKTILIANQSEDVIYIAVFWWSEYFRLWSVSPFFGIPRINYIDRDKSKHEKLVINFLLSPEDPILKDYHHETSALLGLLNILQCSNVTTRISRPKVAIGSRHTKKLKKKSSFDEYHILEIKSSDSNSFNSNKQRGGINGRKAPREHLRRGHIRRLHSGNKIWVNSAVISAGDGGVIHKDYSMVA